MEEYTCRGLYLLKTTSVRGDNTPWMTRLFVAVCVLIYLSTYGKENIYSEDFKAQYGLLHSDKIWDGSYWALVSAAFVHFNIIHILFNMSALWALGRRFEQVYGPVKFIIFFCGTAFLSASYQLAFSDNSGMGASGAICALFGYMWYARKRHQLFLEIMTKDSIKVCMAWLVGCLIITHFGETSFKYANAAHFSGLIFGALLAHILVLKNKNFKVIIPLLTIVIISITSLFYNPISYDFNAQKANQSMAEKNYQKAIDYATHLIWLKPDKSDLYDFRGHAFLQLGNKTAAEKDFKESKRIQIKKFEEMLREKNKKQKSLNLK